MADHPEGCLCTACLEACERRFSIFGDGTELPRGITLADVAREEPIFMAKVAREMTRRATLDAAARNRRKGGV